MKKIKRILLFIILILLIMSLSGCVDANFHLTVNKDGSGDLDYKMLFDPMVLGLAAQGENTTQDPIKQMQDDATKSGFVVTNLNENGKTGFEAKKHIQNLSDSIKQGSLFGSSNMDKSFRPGDGLTIQKGLFKTIYKLNSDLDMSSMNSDPNADAQQKAMTQAMLRSMQFNFAITLPVKATSDNASKTEDNGKTLIWNLVPGQHNQVTFKAEELNITNIILVSAGGVLILAIIIGLVIKIRSNKKNIAA